MKDVVSAAGFFFQDEVTPTVELLIPKKMTAEQTVDTLKHANTALAALTEWTIPAIEGALRSLAEKLGLSAGQLFSPIRAATSGQPVSPPLFETLEVVGRDLTLKRIENAIKLLQKQTA
ncbi:MAG: hypothetical protein U0528_19000 [Anaerolineae bacterium]